MFFVYVLWSESSSEPYVGHTDDLDRRLGEHESGYNRATKHGENWRLVAHEKFKSRSLAIKRERFLKTGRGRDVIKKYISGTVGAVA